MQRFAPSRLLGSFLAECRDILGEQSLLTSREDCAPFEIDWITLSPSPQPATDYTVRWTADNMGSSTYDVDLVDSLGQRFSLAAGLPPATREFTTNLSRLITGSWYFEVRAVPGPSVLSPGPIRLMPGEPVGSLLHHDGFE